MMVGKMNESDAVPTAPTGTDRNLALLGVLERLDANGVPCVEEAVRIGHAAEPLHAGGLETRAGAAEELVHRRVLIDGRNHGPVLRRTGIDEIGRADAASALHVLHHHSRLARDVLAQIAAERAGIEVVAAAHAEADDDLDGLALVEIGNALRIRGRRKAERKPDRCGEEYFDHRVDALPRRLGTMCAPIIRAAWMRTTPRW
jgi:hypothetical protein